jgi:hypothetical protein
MRKTIFLVVFIFTVCVSHAQRFFYVESGEASGQSVKLNLKKNAQFVCPTAISSDYILKTNIGMLQDDRTLSMNIIVKDSVTLETIYESNEKYHFGPITADPKIILNLAINNFIEKNLNQIIATANSNHYNMVNSREKKDHT